LFVLRQGFQFSSPISVDKQHQQQGAPSMKAPATLDQPKSNFSTPSNLAHNFMAAAKPKPKANGENFLFTAKIILLDYVCSLL